ncbi:MAG: PIN domain-containing protein [Actinobacteria bacterium]|nr:PIN domain-containing protein [Actinomycetota bacterium]
MPSYLADTSAWNRSRLVAERWESLLEADELILCAPVALELLYSARGAADYDSLARDLGGFLHLPLDERAERAASRAQSRLAASSHRGPTPVDLLIAAVAQVNDVPLLHYDRHFELIAGVTGQPAEWLAPRGTLTS